MAYQSRAGKRVHAVRRGPDGSAFRKCESCGLSVPIALDDMHKCEIKENVKKKLKPHFENHNVNDQPRSAFRFYIEEFVKTCEEENEVEIDNKAFEKWKAMSNEERLPFVLQADEVNSAYVKLLHKEEKEMQWVDDEADSAAVGKYDENYEEDDLHYSSESFDGLGFFQSESQWSFYSEDSFTTHASTELTLKAP